MSPFTAQSHACGQAQSYAGEARRYRVLLVEDNPAEAELVAESLSSSSLGGFDIVHVVSLHGARMACQVGRFDCIVLDLQLPDSAGVETIKDMRAVNAEAPIVAYSGLDDEKARAAVLREGAQDFISKNAPESGALNRGILYAVERWRALKLHQQFEGLFAVHPDAMFILDEDGGVLFANRAAGNLLARDDTSLARRLRSVEARQGGVRETSFSRDGAERIGEVRAFACDWDGTPAILAAVRDVTEQHELTAKVRKAQKLEAIGRFAGGLAHDLGNMLSCIDVFADLARETVADGSIGDFMDGISRAVHSGRGILDHLISLEQAQSGAPQLIDIGVVLDELYAFLRLALPAGISLRIERQGEVWPVMIDRGQFEQVIVNLVFNARDAMRDGGSVRIECLNAPGGDTDLDRVAVRVSDTGPGIAPKHAQQVFDLFFTTKPPGQGNGLGLATCQSIVEQAGGTIALAPVSAGACFLIVLPRGDAGAGAQWAM